MSTEDNIACIRQSIEALTCIFHDRPGGGTNMVESARQNAIEALTAFPDLHVTLEDLVIAGEKIVARVTYHATHTGDLGGIPPTSKQVTWTGISILHFVDGKVVEDWANSDLLGLMQQIGAIPLYSLLR